MERQPPDMLTERDVNVDLKASLGARRELGSDMEDHVLESFLARVQERIDQRVEQHLRYAGSRPVERSHNADQSPRRTRPSGWVIPAGLGVSIPLVSIAGGLAGAWGILFVMIAVLGVYALYFEKGS